MQNVGDEKNNDKEIKNTDNIPSNTLPTAASNEKTEENISTSESNLGPDLYFGSDDDDMSEVESFMIDQDIDYDEDDEDEEDEDDELEEEEEERPSEPQESSKFLLPPELEEPNLQTIDPETHARLEALLEAAGIGKMSTADGKAFTDPEVLRKLTSSVSCALDEAAQALHKMRTEQQGQIVTGESGRSLAEACSDGDVGAVRKLLHEGGSVNETTEEGESLLSLACSAGYYELAQLLLAMKANVEDRGIKGDCTPLMEAASGGYLDIVKLLIAHKADVNAQSSAGNSALHYAACGGYEDVVQELIGAGANVEVHNENGHTPLMEAASAGHVGVARILLDAGAGINTHSNEFKESALTLACYKGHLEMVKFLLEAGADQEHKTDEMHTALMEASMDGHVEVARLLLDSGAQVNMPADSFESPLTLAACGGHVELANLLIERGANLEEVNDEGYTPLMEAAREGHEEMVALLLTHGADINAQTEETQETALTLACCGGFLDVAEFLIKAGAEIELGCSTPLMEAAQEGHLELVKYLLKACKRGANVHAQTGTGDTALTYACENGHTEVAKVLLEAGAELEHESEGGRTPLMKAARAGHLNTVQFLISKGADVNRTTSTNDHTVLSLACAGGHLQVVELLLSSGGDPAHRLKDGSTMIIESAKGGHTHVVKMLLEYPGNRLNNSPSEISQFLNNDFSETRVPFQGLPNIVPPNEPDSQYPLNAAHFTPNIPLPSVPQLKKNNDIINKENALCKMQTAVVKRSNSHGSNLQKVNREMLSSSEQLNQYAENGGLVDLLPEDVLDGKTSEKKLEELINNVMAKDLGNSSSSREEQILKRQQILEELQKVEKELQAKAHNQLYPFEQQQGAISIPRAFTLPTDENFSKQPNTLVRPPVLGSESGNLEEILTCHINELDSRLAKVINSGLQQSGEPVSQSTVISESSPMFTGANHIPSSNVGEVSTDQNSKKNGGTKSRNKNSSGSNGGSLSVSQQNQQQPQQPPPPPPQQPQVVQQQQLIPSSAVQQQLQQQLPLHQNFNFQVQNQPSSLPSSEMVTQVASNPVLQQPQQFQFPQLQFTPQQKDQLLKCIQQQIQQQQQQQQHQQQVGILQQTLQNQLSPGIPVPQYLNEQQQTQLLQQQQQAQQLLQQQLQQLKQSTVNVNPSKRKLYSPNTLPLENLSQITGLPSLDTITPPSSTPLTPNPSPASPPTLPMCVPIDVDAQTESNHDTALTLACAGGHTDLVNLLLTKGANIEHRDKKGFTPLILAATAGNGEVVEILLDHGADIEAQSERTKDTPLSLACSGGRYEVVELLLNRGANKEHRNVSDYTPLSLAASGGYVNIIKLLLAHGAEINSRTGSKLGISPLMLAAMNGHTPAVKLLLDMGSDINAQIETNRNTALTLACFQGRHEVVSLLVDRRANIEHRAKTGLTPLMEAASGGYVEVGRVLLDKGADVNAPPVPSSRDTALTIAADKGHYRFVELLLSRVAAVDVKNKKGNSPLWLACNGGHLDVVQLVVSSGADVDSQDNRKVSCLMASFRKGHVKVVKWLVKYVSQFPSDQELSRYIATVQDKELQKKCEQCMEIIISAKDRQAAEANKNANILLEELDKERQEEENRKAAAAKKRERRKKKKKEKQEREKEQNKGNTDSDAKESSVEKEESQPVEEEIPRVPTATTTTTIGPIKDTVIYTESKSSSNKTLTEVSDASVATNNKKIATPSEIKKSRKKKGKDKDKSGESSNGNVPTCSVMTTVTSTTATLTTATAKTTVNSSNKKNKEINVKSNACSTGIGDLDDFGTLPGKYKLSEKEIERITKSAEKSKPNSSSSNSENSSNKERANQGSAVHKLSVKSNNTVVNSPKRNQKKEEGWKEVIRKSKKMPVPASAISRIIGRSGCNINAIREVSGANIDFEKQKSGDGFISIRGSAEATRQAYALITALIQDPDKELVELIPKSNIRTKPTESPAPVAVPNADMNIGVFTLPTTTQTSVTGGSHKQSGKGSKNSSGTQKSHQSNTSANNIANFPIQVWSGPPQPTPPSPRRNQKNNNTVPSQSSSGTLDKTNVSRQLFSDRKTPGTPPSTSTHSTVTYSNSALSSRTSTTSSMTRPEIRQSLSARMPNSSKSSTPQIRVLQRPSASNSKTDAHPLPIVNQTNGSLSSQSPASLSSSSSSLSSTTQADYSPFTNNIFSSVAGHFLLKKEDEKMNFASVAAAGVVTSSVCASSITSPGPAMVDPKFNPALQAKAPGYKANTPVQSNANAQSYSDSESNRLSGSFRIPANYEALMEAGYRRAPTPNSNMSPRSNSSTPSGLSPRGRVTPLESSHNASGLQTSHPSLSSQREREEYTVPNQPMTLPKIESKLNPHAPDFTSRVLNANLNNMVTPGGIPPNVLAQQMFSGMFVHGANAQQQLLNAAALGNLSPTGNFQNPPPAQPQPPSNGRDAPQQNFMQQGNPVPVRPGMVPNPNVAPNPNLAPRSFSPVPAQGRPSSAPSMGTAPKDPVAPGLSTSPLPPNIPNHVDNQMKLIEETKVLRPIGGERAHRKAMVSDFSAIPDFGAMWSLASADLNSDWSSTNGGLMTSASLTPSVNTTSVLNGVGMSTGQINRVEEPPPFSSSNSSDNVQGMNRQFMEGVSLEQVLEQSSQNPYILQFLTNGLPNQFPMPPGFPGMNTEGPESVTNPPLNKLVSSAGDDDGEKAWRSWNQ